MKKQKTANKGVRLKIADPNDPNDEIAARFTYEFERRQVPRFRIPIPKEIESVSLK